MIAFINGQVAGIGEDHLILENQGIGYLIRTPQHVLHESSVGGRIKLHTYLHVREDAISLFGFSSEKERDTFKILLGISGIGPKVALSVLSTLSMEELYYAVFGDDAKSIARTPGIGPKGAKRMIMELKDKLDIEEIRSGIDAVSGLDQDAAGEEGSVLASATTDQMSDAIMALEALGYAGADAYRAVHSVPDAGTKDSGQLLKEALKYMNR